MVSYKDQRLLNTVLSVEFLYRSDKEIISLTLLIINKAEEGVKDVVRARYISNLKERVSEKVSLIRHVYLCELPVPCCHLYKVIGSLY